MACGPSRRVEFCQPTSALAALATHLAALSQQAATQLQVWEAALAAQQERERQQQLVAPRLDEARRQLVSLQAEVSEGQAVCRADAQALWLISPIRSSGSITSTSVPRPVPLLPRRRCRSCASWRPEQITSRWLPQPS